ncbi:MAG: GTPase, partial [Agathobacter rectalis]
STRRTMRAARDRSGLKKIAIVGYTNAGKSTLLNRLTDAGILAEDKLFATLDPTTRILALDGKQQVLLTDTVGFIRKLPHHLIEAFKSTLEEAKYADIIFHVVDASNMQREKQMFITY